MGEIISNILRNLKRGLQAHPWQANEAKPRPQKIKSKAE